MAAYQTATMNAAEIAAAQPKHKRDGKGWRIPCPAHGGEDLNLRIWDGDGGRIAAKCWSRDCDWHDIMAALGIDPGEPDLRGRPHHVRTYRAGDGSPRPVFRRDDADGKQVWGDGSPVGALVALWPIPDADGSELVVLVEGEKAAAAVQAAGWTAASWRGGTSAVSGADYTPLEGRAVLLWPDADEPGRRAMQTAAAALKAHGCTVRVLDAPGDSGEDAADLTPAAIAARIDEGGDEPEPPAPAVVDADDFPYGRGLPDPMSWQAHAMRLLREAPERLLVVWEPKRRASLRVLREGGVWGEDYREMKEIMTAASDKWIASYLRDSDFQKGAAIKAHRQACAEDGVHTVVKDVNYAAGWYERNDPLEGLTECEREDLDAGLFLGTPDGVVDLETGALLPPAEGRRQLVTMRTAVPFDLEARDARVDALTAHLDPADEEYLWGVFARALTGRPLGFIAIMGETSAGKSTLINAIAAAFGEYAHPITPAVIAAGRSESAARPELAHLARHRLVHLEESVRDGATVSAETVKRYWDSGSRVTWRALYSNVIESAPVTATLALSFNEMKWAAGKGASPALLRRMRTLVYPRPPRDRGADYKRAVESDPTCQRAVLARLVRTGIAHGWQEPPAGPGVEASKRAQRAAVVGDALADWADTHVVREEGARLWSSALWDEAQRSDLGMERKDLAQGIAQYFGLGASVVRRRPETGKKERCWEGARLASEPEQAAMEQEPEMTLADRDGIPSATVTDLPASATLRLADPDAIREQLQEQGARVIQRLREEAATFDEILEAERQVERTIDIATGNWRPAPSKRDEGEPADG